MNFAQTTLPFSHLPAGEKMERACPPGAAVVKEEKEEER